MDSPLSRTGGDKKPGQGFKKGHMGWKKLPHFSQAGQASPKRKREGAQTNRKGSKENVGSTAKTHPLP